MPVTSIKVSYRPVRIGFLIRDGSIEDFIACVEINTILWGGIYNPIIPVGNSMDSARRLIDLFAVDILMPIVADENINQLLKEYSFLSNSFRFGGKDIYIKDFKTSKKVPAYLDVIQIINYHWEDYFKHQEDHNKSNCTYISWSEKDDLNNLFKVLFGHYPKDTELKHNYENVFKNGLRSNTETIVDGISADLVLKTVPIGITTDRLKLDISGHQVDGIFIGDSSDKNDLLSYWNLRASGIVLRFLPLDKISRFEQYINKFIGLLDEVPSSNQFYDKIGVYYSNLEIDVIEEVLKNFKSKKGYIYHRLIDLLSWLSPNRCHFGEKKFCHMLKINMIDK